MCEDCKASSEVAAVEDKVNMWEAKTGGQVYRMSHEMRSYLDGVTSQHGFHTRMAVPCSRCGETADLGFVHIVAKDDIEQHGDFQKFRTYRDLREGQGGTTAYRRTSRQATIHFVNKQDL